MKNMYALQRLPFLFCCLLSLFSFTVFAQVGIGNTDPAESSLLDIRDGNNNKGILVPRVNIENLTTKAPITTATIDESLLVYNTNITTGKGFYYWNGAKWIGIDGENDWKLTGNSGTTAGTNFIGTTDDVHFELFTYNTSRMRIQNNGQVTVGFGAGMANANQQVNIVSTFTNGVAVGGYSGGSGSGVFGKNEANGNGVFGLNNNTGNGVYGRTQGVGTGVKGESSTGDGWSVQGVNAPIFSDNVSSQNDAFFGLTDSNVNKAFWGINHHASGVGILGASDNLSIYPTGGVGVSGSGTKAGIYGYAGAGTAVNNNRGNAAGLFELDTDSDSGTNGTNDGTRASAKLAGFDNISPDGTLAAADSYYGGYFSGGNENSGTRSYAYAGIKYGASANGTGGTNYKIIGNGTNSTLINDSQGNPRIMFSPEAPEILFQDYGVGKLLNGQARINIDPILKKSLYIDTEHPLKVLVTLEGDCNGVYVTDKSIDGFTVKELQNGRSNVSFSWQIIASRADDKDANGKVTSKHVGLRLPMGPGPLKSPKAIKVNPNAVYNLENDTKKNIYNKKNVGTLSQDELVEIRQNLSVEERPLENKKLEQSIKFRYTVIHSLN